MSTQREIPSIIDGRFKLTKHIASGGYGDVYKCISLGTNEEYAVKMELAKKRYSALEHECTVYKELVGGPGIPSVKWSGCEGGYNIMVLDLLGLTLWDLMNDKKRNHFSLKTTIMVVDQMLYRLEYLHAHNYLHRDIKPNNFLMGRRETKNVVYLLDLGLAMKYRDASTHEHIPFTYGKQCVTNETYASLNNLSGFESSRRDDLESLGYILLHLLTGYLPWGNIRIEDKNQKLRAVRSMKRHFSIEGICEGLPDEITCYMKHVRNLDFAAEPNYKYLHSLLRNLFAKNHFNLDYVYDWSTGTGTGTDMDWCAAPKCLPEEKEEEGEGEGEGEDPVADEVTETGAGAGAGTETGTVTWTYQLKERIARGGCGDVYLAESYLGPFFGDVCALKFVDTGHTLPESVLLPELCTLRERFQQCQHRSLLRYEKVSLTGPEMEKQVGPGFFLVMDYCAGGTLAELLTECRKKRKYFDDRDLLIFVTRVGGAVQTLHQKGFVHGDLKPGVIFLSKKTRPADLKVGDSGVSCAVASLVKTTTAKCTIGYTAPESLNGDMAYTFAKDVYSLGCIILELIDLCHPFGNPANGVLQQERIFAGRINPARAGISPVARAVRDFAISMVAKDAKARPRIDALLSLPQLKTVT